MLARVDRVLAPLIWLTAALVVVLLLAGPSLVGAEKEKAAAPTGGAQVFGDAGCGGCHTFTPAKSTGAVGPNLDDAGLDAQAVEAIVRDGRDAMPAFGTRLSAAEIAEVARFVAGEEAAPQGTTAIPAGEGPDGITAAPDGTVWVTDATAGTLLRIQPSADKTAPAIEVGRQPDSPAVDGDSVWLVTSDAVVRVTGEEVARVPAGREPSGLAVDPDTVWVANAGDDTVTRIDRATAKPQGAPIAVGGRPTDVAMAGGVTWVTNFDDGTVSRIEGQRTTTVRVGSKPRGIAAGGGAIWVANAGDDTVTRLSASGATTATIDVGSNPRELSVADDGVWVANAGDDTVTRIDPATNAADDPIETGDDPIGIAVTGDAVYTADFRAGTVTRIAR